MSSTTAGANPAGSPTRPLAHVYDAAYRGPPPNWDVGHPQQAFVHLAEAGYIRGRVLDVGCGTGELSLFLASRGHEVLGIDFAPAAIETARAKARWRRVPAHFLVWDALDLGSLGIRVDTVVDSAMLHLLGQAERGRFVDGLETVLGPGGRYFVLADARPPGGDPSRGGLSRADVDRLFPAADGWRVDFVYRTWLERHGGGNPAVIAGMTRTGSRG